MTSEEQSDDLPAMTIDDPSTATSEADPLETSGKSMETDEPTASETPKRGGRKKRDEPASDNGKSDTQPLFEQPIILEGKRSRKPTSRLELTELSPPKKEVSIPQGHGKPLGDIAYINFQITHAPNEILTRLRTICFGRRSTRSDLRKTLLEFKGFDFTRESDEYQRHLTSLTKLKNDQLQSIGEILGLTAAAEHKAFAEQILQFLMLPVDEGKAVPERAQPKRTTNDEKVENGDDDDEEIFNIDDDEDDDVKESDDDYIGSDEEISTTNNDDPDDFVYQPGRKAPKRKTPLKRARSSTTNKRKRTSKTKAKPVVRPKRTTRTRSQVAMDDEEVSTVDENKVEKEIPATNESISTNDEEKKDETEEKSEQTAEPESKPVEQTNSQPATDTIPATTVDPPVVETTTD